MGGANSRIIAGATPGCGNPNSRRGMMAKAAKGKKGGKVDDGKAGAKEDNRVGLGVVPINYLKDGQHPAIKPDEEYPEWLWELPVNLEKWKRNNSSFFLFRSVKHQLFLSVLDTCVVGHVLFFLVLVGQLDENATTQLRTAAVFIVAFCRCASSQAEGTLGGSSFCLFVCFVLMTPTQLSKTAINSDSFLFAETKLSEYRCVPCWCSCKLTLCCPFRASEAPVDQFCLPPYAPSDPKQLFTVMGHLETCSALVTVDRRKTYSRMPGFGLVTVTYSLVYASRAALCPSNSGAYCGGRAAGPSVHICPNGQLSCFLQVLFPRAVPVTLCLNFGTDAINTTSAGI